VRGADLGTLIFGSDRHAAALETGLLQALQRRLGKAIPVIARTAPDWPALVATNPFPNPRRG
jgi:uncharacterized protein (DUF1697 family)